MILLYYIITKNVENKLLNGNEYVVKTIVTTEAKSSVLPTRTNIRCMDCYTGFKWIADVMRNIRRIPDAIWAAARRVTGSLPRRSCATQRLYLSPTPLIAECAA